MQPPLNKEPQPAPEQMLQQSANGSRVTVASKSTAGNNGEEGERKTKRYRLPFPPAKTWGNAATRPGYTFGSLREAWTGPVRAASRDLIGGNGYAALAPFDAEAEADRDS